MAVVKGKHLICQSNIGDFNVEQINGSPFYARYGEFVSVFRKHLKDFDPESIFAQPEENKANGSIDWFIPAFSEEPESLEALKQRKSEEYSKYALIRDSVIRRMKGLRISSPQEQLYFNCAVKCFDYEYLDSITYCYDNKITFAVWGMKMLKGRTCETVIRENMREHRVHTVNFVIEGNGRFRGQSTIYRKHGYVLAPRDIPEVVANPHFRFAKWNPEAPHGKIVNGNMTYSAICERDGGVEISFFASEGGYINGQNSIYKGPGMGLLESDVPMPVADNGYHFDHWEPMLDFNNVINGDCSYCAVFAPDQYIPTRSVRFIPGENGTIESGNDEIIVNDGDLINENFAPKIKPKEGYKFVGWDKDFTSPIFENTVYTAKYEKLPLPWWKTLFTKGCLTKLLWLLLILLLLLLLAWLLKDCKGCSCDREDDIELVDVDEDGIPDIRDDFVGDDDIIDEVVVIDTVRTDDGRIIDDNGPIISVPIDDGKLPDCPRIVAPVVDDEGRDLPVIERPGLPDIISNRLLLYLEDENGDVDALASDFKKAYPDKKYSVVSFDREVRMIAIQVPPEERENIRKTINSKLPNHKFFVFDEQIYELKSIGKSKGPVSDRGWHLKAINLKKGWEITKGSEDIKIAVVDDGIDASHSIFKGRIICPYNVFTKSNKLSKGEGHGTHTAGLAAGSDEFFDKGASGVAPRSKLIPIQVFDNKRCPLSALVSGIMYAIHKDADVVNISIGPSFGLMHLMPIDEQKRVSEQEFKNMEKLWKHVSNLAEKKKCVLVFSAGNDKILLSIPPENRNRSSIVVAAVDKNLRPSEFTNYGSFDENDISAPGTNIYSSFPGNSFRAMDGTSMSAPIITGTIALMKSIKKDITVEQIRNVLYRTGAKVNGKVSPMVLVDKALEATQRGDFSSPFPSKKPSVEKVDRPASEIGEGRGDRGRVVVDDPDRYLSIRERIRIYKEKIRELEKQLPENR